MRSPQAPSLSPRRAHRFGWTLLFVAALLPLSLSAAGVTARMVDADDQPVVEAVFSLVPRDGSRAAAAEPPRAIMDQWGKQFIPYVLPVQVGTRVSFPNRDNIKHHVYSFSPAKRFELKLYSFGAAQPVLFDQPGIVALGCNIHDWMQAWIAVLDTPYFAKTDEEGRAVIENVPDGTYRAEVWHPRLRGDAAGFAQQVVVSAGKPVALHFTLPLKRARRRAPPLYYEGGEY